MISSSYLYTFRFSFNFIRVQGLQSLPDRIGCLQFGTRSGDGKGRDTRSRVQGQVQALVDRWGQWIERSVSWDTSFVCLKDSTGSPA